MLGLGFGIAMLGIIGLTSLYWRLHRKLRRKSSDELLPGNVHYNADTEETGILHGNVQNTDNILRRMVLVERLQQGIDREVEDIGAATIDVDNVTEAFAFGPSIV